ncbi:hypothetical protein KLO01_13440 [Knoellia locipacati]|uniref:DUF4185 domain-containing protein n=1 Tax=Knoellia locipacati TaxID=882824 RepID=A0A512SZB5_9MICO|nr:hypothetical protein KLO01_13440 [Knoellia locipacati]
MVRIRTDLALGDAATGIQTGTVSEPSVAASGSGLFVTGNWYATHSPDMGASWEFLDPFTELPADRGRFGCDQVVLRVGRLWVWLLQYEPPRAGQNNIQRLAVSSTGRPRSWRWWDLAPSDLVRSWDKVWFDFPDLGLTRRHLVLTTNVYDASDRWVRAVVVRWPRAGLTKAGPLPHEYWTTTTAGSLRPVAGAGAGGAGDTMWFGSTDVSSSSLRVFAWPDSSPSVTQWSVRVSPWDDSDYDSVGPAGGEWLSRADDRVTGAFRVGSRLGFAWSSGRRADRPHPFVRCAVIDESTLDVVAEPDLWSATGPWAYPALAPSVSGRVGMAAYFGERNLPALAVGALSGFPPRSGGAVPAWEMATVARSTHTPTDGKWGDYLTVRPHPSRRTSWVAAGATLQGGTNRRNIEPRVVVFST